MGGVGGSFKFNSGFLGSGFSKGFGESGSLGIGFKGVGSSISGSIGGVGFSGSGVLINSSLGLVTI